MFKIEEVKGNRHQFIIRTDEPTRIEVLGLDKGLIAFGYKGIEDNQDQEPDVMFDSTN